MQCRPLPSYKETLPTATTTDPSIDGQFWPTTKLCTVVRAIRYLVMAIVDFVMSTMPRLLMSELRQPARMFSAWSLPGQTKRIESFSRSGHQGRAKQLHCNREKPPEKVELGAAAGVTSLPPVHITNQTQILNKQIR